VSGQKVKERVDYHSPYRIGVFEAMITAVNKDGTVALDVYLPGASVARLEAAVHLRSVTYGPEGRARPKG